MGVFEPNVHHFWSVVVSGSSRIRTHRARLHAAGLLAVVVGGVVLSVVLYRYVEGFERRNLLATVNRRAEERAELLRTTMLQSMEVLHSVDALFRTQSPVSRSEFRAFVTDALQRQTELLALGWTPRVPRAGRADLE